MREPIACFLCRCSIKNILFFSRFLFQVVFNSFFFHELTSYIILILMSGFSMYKIFDGLILLGTASSSSRFRNFSGYVFLSCTSNKI